MIASATNAASGGTTLFKIADLDRLFVRVKIDEADVAKVKPGQHVLITADALPGKTFQGKVLRVAPQGQVESNVTVFDLIVEIDARGRLALRPMLTANIEIVVAKATGVIILSTTAVRGRGKGASVLVEGQGRREVVLGLASGKNVEIRSGITEGTRVVLPTRRSRKPGDTAKGKGGKRGGAVGLPRGMGGRRR